MSQLGTLTGYASQLPRLLLKEYTGSVVAKPYSLTRNGMKSLGWMLLQVLQEAKAIDDRAARGEDVGPLCGLGFVSKDNIDFKGFPTIAGNPALEG